MAKQIYLLDASLRDGGQGLEDCYKNKFTTKSYSRELINDTIRLLGDSNVDIIELGAMGPSDDDKSMFAIYQNVEELSKTLPKERKENQLYVGLYIGPDTPVEKIPKWNPDLVEGIRVILRYSELQKSLDYCAALAEKGYKTFVQPMLTMRYTDKELDLIIKASNDMGAYALYFVDSYGYMQNEDIKRLFEYYEPRLNKDMRIGFHAHNNMNMAFSNVKYFLNIDTDRELIVDSCITGMGQGAGNMQTELLVPYMNEKFDKNYNYDAVLDICDMMEDTFITDNLWGYSTTRLLPAVYKTAYKYALILRNVYHLKLKEINYLLKVMPDELRNRYTQQNVEQVVSMLKK